MAPRIAWSLTPLASTQAGISLSVRNVLSISVILTGTSLVANLGAVTLAAHEIVRQVLARASRCLLQPTQHGRHLAPISRCSSLRALVMGHEVDSALGITPPKSDYRAMYSNFLRCVLSYEGASTAHLLQLQVWIFFMNVFTSLDIAANSLVASYMGRGDRLEAQRVLRRILSLGVFAGACMATLMVGGAEIAPAGFTTDRGVRAAASRVFPLLGLLLVRYVCQG